MFGDSWTRNYGPVDEHGVWLAGLRRAELTPQQLGAGLQAVLTSGATFPPSLPEFIRLCRPLQGMAGQQAASAPVSRAKALPITDEERARRREVARKHLDEARQLLGMPPRKDPWPFP